MDHEKTAKPRAKRNTKFGRELLQLAHEQRFTEIPALLASAKTVDAAEPAVAEAFLLSPFANDIELVKRYLERGVPFDTQFKGLNIVQIAAKLPFPDFVRQLLQLGNAANLFRESVEDGALVGCIQAASQKDRKQLIPGYLETLKLLIDAGAEVNQIQFGRSPLDHACKGGVIEIAALLLDHGAHLCDANAALMDVITARNSEMLRMLIRRGINPAANARQALTLVTHATGLGAVEMLEILIESGCPATLLDGSDALEKAKQNREGFDKFKETLGLFGAQLRPKT